MDKTNTADTIMTFGFSTHFTIAFHSNFICKTCIVMYLLIHFDFDEEGSVYVVLTRYGGKQVSDPPTNLLHLMRELFFKKLGSRIYQRRICSNMYSWSIYG